MHTLGISARRNVVVIISCFSVLVLGVGCAAVESDTSEKVDMSELEIPEFSGPWAFEFAKEYRKAESDFVREVLADGKITDQEHAEMRSRFTDCLTGRGFSEISFEANGAFGLKFPENMDSDVVDDWVMECSNETGESSIGALHSEIRRNPDNLDENEIMAACLVRKGVVDPSYQANDYREQFESWNFSFTDRAAGESARRACNLDPLGLYG